jgi:hypothetical protein
MRFRKGERQRERLASMQPFARPALCDLVDKRIDYLAAFQIAGQREPELRWCQGGVITVLD